MFTTNLSFFALLCKVRGSMMVYEEEEEEEVKEQRQLDVCPGV
jgi:hypothetical protein